MIIVMCFVFYYKPMCNRFYCRNLATDAIVVDNDDDDVVVVVDNDDDGCLACDFFPHCLFILLVSLKSEQFQTFCILS